MGKDTEKNIKLGLFVLLGTAFIIIGMYFIGDKQNLFGSTFRVETEFKNVNGLMSGNNVRYAGVNVGTVENVQIVNDTTIRVTMVLKDETKKYIKNNVEASIGTDGLMGNKLINLKAIIGEAGLIQEGDQLKAQGPLETDKIMQTLNGTNEDVSKIAKNLKEITEKINNPNSLWSVLMDPKLAQNINHAVVNLEITGSNAATITGDLSQIIKNIKAGKGSIGALLTDTSFSGKLNQTLVNIKVITDTLGYISGDLKDLSQKIKNGEGAIGTILMDTTFTSKLNQSMENIKNGTAAFDENMQALQQNFLLRRYFKNQEKKQK